MVSAVALTVLVYERTGSPFLSSLTFAFGFLPYVVGGALLSGIVDRVPARRLLTASDHGALLVALMASPGNADAGLLVLLLLTGTVTSTSSGARNGLVARRRRRRRLRPRPLAAADRRAERADRGQRPRRCCCSSR